MAKSPMKEQALGFVKTPEEVRGDDGLARTGGEGE